MFPEVIKSAGEEGREGWGEGDGPVPARHTDPDPNHVLLADEALDEPVSVNLHYGFDYLTMN